jgi:hypothetical protein
VRVERSAPGERRFISLQRGVGDALKTEGNWALSPAAPLGLVAIPATIAWDIVASPFCLLGDALAPTRKEQIRIVDGF